MSDETNVKLSDLTPEVEQDQAMNNPYAEEQEQVALQEKQSLAELFIATIRFIDVAAQRGAVQGGEMGAVSSIRDSYVRWLVDNGFINNEQ